MGNISKAYYEEIPENIVDIRTAGEFYYHHNLLGIDPMFHQDYEDHETEQFNLRNKIIGNALRRGDIDGRVKMNTAVLAISSIKNKVVIVSDVN